MKTLRSLGTVAVAMLLLAGVLLAQAPTAGRITGTVMDDQGGPLPGVSVEAKSPRLVGTATALTDANGVYRLLALPPGTYTITFTSRASARSCARASRSASNRPWPSTSR